MRPSKHVHTRCDGRGRRSVFLDGVYLTGVVYADTKRGIVRAFDSPPKIDKRLKRIITHTLRGLVEVVPIDESKNIHITNTIDIDSSVDSATIRRAVERAMHQPIEGLTQ